MRSKLLTISVWNIGCIGNEGLTVDLDNLLCLVGDNNSGKSTVLRAYELAVGTQSYSLDKDYCKRSKGEPAAVEIAVHIPEGTANIGEKWKEQDGELLIVRSRWEWDEAGTKSRKTYDPELGDFSEDGNAAGLDNVFNSRLPIPFRIGALENPQAELANLMRLIVDPIAEGLKSSLRNKDSEISRALATFASHAKKPVDEHKEVIEKLNREISNSHNKIFPNLSIDLSIGMAEMKVEPLDALIRGSRLSIKEYENNVDWDQQGTGSQRALFWSLLQVRSRLQALKNSRSDTEKKIKQLEKDIKKLENEAEKAKTEQTRDNKKEQIGAKIVELSFLKELDHEKHIHEQHGEISLPGYMLLIDEPEIALHPNGIRAASKYLYDLAKDSSWQVMITTHSPLFIDPFEDHTTIVRLSRNEGNPSPKTYKSDSVALEEREIENLKLLNYFDQNLSEMFFGQYPIIVEGDTEHASFSLIMRGNIDKYPLNCRPILIRARGKFTMVPLIKMLTHFKVDFSILHDSDFPMNKNGNVNSAWTGNTAIYEQVKTARMAGLRVVHRSSISTFEVAHDRVHLDENGQYLQLASKDKPWLMYQLISNAVAVRESVESVLDQLLDKGCQEEPYSTAFDKGLLETFKSWVKENHIQDTRFFIS